MPLLTVEMVGEPDPDTRPGLAARIADAAGEALASRPGGTWVRLRVLPAGDYAENGAGADPGIRPVFVAVIERDTPPGGPDPARARRLTEAIAAATGRPAANVHVVYEAAGRGRVAFGGNLV